MRLNNLVEAGKGFRDDRLQLRRVTASAVRIARDLEGVSITRARLVNAITLLLRLALFETVPPRLERRR